MSFWPKPTTMKKQSSHSLIGPQLPGNTVINSEDFAFFNSDPKTNEE